MRVHTSIVKGKTLVASSIFFLSALLMVLPCAATNYYVSAKGDDGASGLSPASAWATIKKVNSSKFLPGDSILFKRGDAWRGGQALYIVWNGAIRRPIVFGTYGKGAKPLILGSRDISSPDYWVKGGENIWKTTSKINLTNRDFNLPGSQYRQLTPDISNLIFNNEESVGVKRRFINGLKSQGDYCLNLEDTLIYLYSKTNPAEYYKKIEATGIRNAENNIEVVNRRYLVFTNLDVRYSKNNGIFLFNCSDVVITNCDFSWIGGCYFPIETFMNNPSPNLARMGNGIQMWQGNANITITNCKIDQVYDAGISPQGVGAIYTIHNLRMHHNVISNCFYSFEFWGHQAGSAADSIFFENNTCVNAGGGWSTAQRPDKDRCAHLQFSTSRMKMSNVFIRNNIFDGSVCFCSDGMEEGFGSNTDAVWAGFTMDYNCYFQPTKRKQIIRWRGGTMKGGGDYFMDDLKGYREKSGKELHTLFSDPALTPDFTLSPGSPAIDAGVDAGYPFSGKAPDIGAYEFSGSK